MPQFSKRSEIELSTVHEDLQQIAYEAIKYFDFAVLQGYRTEGEQNEAFKTNKSRLQFPDSKHNRLPSDAFDLVPSPIDWEDTSRFYYMAGVIKTIAAQKGIKLRWGGDFNRDGNLKNDKFIDLPHFERETD